MCGLLTSVPLIEDAVVEIAFVHKRKDALGEDVCVRFKEHTK